ncbi:MAG: tRNA lysidine(34) synthetase TilS [Deltaproteobacteria bacterium]|nr:tRNA lysidine(34) synthetase TilS [Deltaproteobacteria bacterium]
MFDTFIRTLTGPCDVKRGDSILVCLSGGIDSMVLLHLMKEASAILDLRLGVLHVDHGIRGADSKRDAQFVQNVCRDMSVKFFLEELHLGADRPNLEEMARVKRYEAIIECMHAHGFNFAATGHTLDDQVETILYRFIRGSGIRGMSGIQYAREDGIIRPLLDITKTQIDSFALGNHIDYMEDLTNKDISIPRNLIRHEIIPLMQRINPCVIQSIARFSKIAAKEGAILDEMVTTLIRDAIKLDWGIIRCFDKGKLIGAKGAIAKRLIIDIISEMIGEPRGIDALQVDMVMDVLHSKRASHDIKRKVRVVSCKEDIVFHVTGQGPFYNATVKSPGIYYLPRINQSIRIGYNASHLDLLTIRSWLPGDTIHGKKVVKILSDNGIIQPLRVFWPVVLNRGEIVAIAGIKNLKTLDNNYNLNIEFPYVA